MGRASPVRQHTSPMSSKRPGVGAAGQPAGLKTVVESSSRRDASRIGGYLVHFRRWAAPLLIIVALLLAWELWTRLGDVPKWQLPAPSAIAQELAKSRGLLWEHTQVTLFEVLLGMVAALI